MWAVVIASALVGAVAGAGLGWLMLPRLRLPAPPRSPAEQVEFMRNVLAFLLVSAFISVLPALTFKAIPAANEQILTYMLGQLSGMATMVLGFYFVNKAGQDRVDAEKTANTGKLADLATRALETTAEPPGVKAAEASGARQATKAAEETAEDLEAKAASTRGDGE